MPAIPATVHRRGSLLVVMLGLVLLMLGMTLAIAIRVKSSMDQSGLMERHAQAYLMMRSAKLYLMAKFTEPTRNAAEYQTEPMKILGAADGSAATGGDGRVASSPDLNTALGSLSDRQGWFHLRRSSATVATVLAAGGGGGISSGTSSQTKRSPATIFGGSLGAADPREAFDVVYAFTLTQPAGGGTTPAISVAVVPSATKANTSYW